MRDDLAGDVGIDPAMPAEPEPLAAPAGAFRPPVGVPSCEIAEHSASHRPAGKQGRGPPGVLAVTGRPTKYDPSYCDRVIEFCTGGSGLSSFAAEIGVARKTLHNWGEAHPEFAYAMEVAKACACRWYEQRLRKIVDGDGGPGAATAVIFALKNFGEADFSDRREVSHVGRVAHVGMTYAEAIEDARRRGLPERVLEE